MRFLNWCHFQWPRVTLNYCNLQFCSSAESASCCSYYDQQCWLLKLVLLVVCIKCQQQQHKHHSFLWMNIESVLFFSCPRSEGWPHTMDILSPFISVLSVILIDSSAGVLSTSWCCPSRLCVIFIACMHRALFVVLSLSPNNLLLCFLTVWP